MFHFFNEAQRLSKQIVDKGTYNLKDVVNVVSFVTFGPILPIFFSFDKTYVGDYKNPTFIFKNYIIAGMNLQYYKTFTQISGQVYSDKHDDQCKEFKKSSLDKFRLYRKIFWEIPVLR